MRRRHAEKRPGPLFALATGHAGGSAALRVSLLVAGLLPFTLAQAQNAPALRLSPYASAELTLTDNYNASGAGGAADAVTRLTAGVVARGRTGRIVGFLDYNLTAALYANHGSNSKFENQLTANLEAEWYERQGFLTAGASISQVARSAFGAQPTEGGLRSANSTESRSVRIAPRWQGQVAGLASVNLQAAVSATNANNSTAGDGHSTVLSGRLAALNPARITWALDGARETSDYSLTRSTLSTRGYGSVFATLSDLDLRLNARLGRERSNYSSITPTEMTTWGMGLEWRPSPRTKLSAQLEERSFGTTHSVTFEYRTPRTVWQLSESRGISTGATTLGIGQRGLAFDLFFAQFASIEPDFGRRADLVDAYLKTSGLAPNSIVATTFLRSATTIDDRQELSVAWRGPRFTAAMNVARSVAERLDRALTGQDDLDQASRIRQTSWTLALSHRLTSDMTAGLSLTAQRSAGDVLAGSLLPAQRSSQQGLVLRLGGQFSAQDSWGLAFRHTRFDNNQQPYSANALVATYGVRF